MPRTDEQKPLYDDMTSGIEARFKGFINIRELSCLIGICCMVSVILNTFGVPAGIAGRVHEAAGSRGASPSRIGLQGKDRAKLKESGSPRTLSQPSTDRDVTSDLNVK